MEFDNGDYEILSKEEWRERIYGSGFEAPIGENGEMVLVLGDDARAAATAIAEQTGLSPDAVAFICYSKRYGMLHWKNDHAS